MLAELVLEEAKKIDPKKVHGLDLGEPEYDDEFVAGIADNSIKQLIGLRQNLNSELQKIRRSRLVQKLKEFDDSVAQSEEDIEEQVALLVEDLKQNFDTEDFLENKIYLTEIMLWAEIKQLMPLTRKKAKYKICKGLNIFRVVEMEEMMDRLKSMRLDAKG